MYLRNSFLLFILIFGFFQAHGQLDPQLNAPYSRFGIGEIQEGINIRNLGMGNAGVGSMQPGFLNFHNPALLSKTRINKHIVRAGETFESLAQFYKISEEELLDANPGIKDIIPGKIIIVPTRKYTMWDVALRSDTRLISTEDASFTSGGFFFDHFVYGIPLQRRWSAAIGIESFSRVNYNVNLRSPFPGDTATAIITDQGTGGLYQAFLSNGIDITENFSLGLQTGFLFGNITREVFTGIENDPAGQLRGQRIENYYSGLVFTPGLAYSNRISRSSHQDSLTILSFGAKAQYHTATFLEEQLRQVTQNTLGQTIDDTILGSTSGYISFPSTYTAGIAINRPGKWTVATDFRYSTFENLEQFSRNDSLKNSFRISVGGELNSRNSDAERINEPVYRAGLFYGKTPYVVNNEHISEKGFTLGASFPVSKRAHLEAEKRYRDNKIPYTTINLALTAGQRGSKENNLARELFFNVHAGIIITDKWFIKRKIQ